MSESIGESLGVILALTEQDLKSNPDDDELLGKIEKISSAYRNFSAGGLQNFTQEFERGYERGKADAHADQEPLAAAHERIFGYDPSQG